MNWISKSWASLRDNRDLRFGLALVSAAGASAAATTTIIIHERVFEVHKEAVEIHSEAVEVSRRAIAFIIGDTDNPESPGLRQELLSQLSELGTSVAVMQDSVNVLTAQPDHHGR